MEKKDILSKILASAGTALVWLPLIAPVFFSVMSFLRDHRFRLDYLTPAELFPSVLIGGFLLLGAAFRGRLHRRIIGGSLAVAAAALIGGQGLAVATGLASGAAEPVGWPWALVVASIIGYLLAVVTLGIGGLFIMRRLFGNPRPPEAVRRD
jgi:hypothetical protein